ncbi:MAG: Uncharacterised protein [Hyphomonas sp. TMED17]|nr:MAG: Uncharacterised protein [Hyphomonas sp. TMED17]
MMVNECQRRAIGQFSRHNKRISRAAKSVVFRELYRLKLISTVNKGKTVAPSCARLPDKTVICDARAIIKLVIGLIKGIDENIESGLVFNLLQGPQIYPRQATQVFCNKFRSGVGIAFNIK